MKSRNRIFQIWGAYIFCYEIHSHFVIISTESGTTSSLYAFFYMNKLECPSRKDALSNYLRNFVIIIPWKRAWPCFWTNLTPFISRMICAKFGWNWRCGSREEDFLILSMYFRYFVIISSKKKVGPFIWTNLYHLYQRMLSVKFGWIWPMILEKKIF